MKQRQTIKIDDKEITITELTIQELLYLCHRTGWVKDLPDMINKDQFDKYKNKDVWDVALSLISDISMKDLFTLAPSEIKKLCDVFMKVNEATLSAAKYFGVDKVVDDMKENLTKFFMADYGKLLTAKK